MASILITDDEEIIVNCLVSSEKNLRGNKTQFIVDTGAKTTMLNWETIKYLGYTKEDIHSKCSQILLDTAGGSGILAYTMCLPMISFNGYVYQNIFIIIGDVSTNLFGRDLITCFNWNIDYDNYKVDLAFRGVRGEGHMDLGVTGNPKDFCCHYTEHYQNLEGYYN